MKLKLRVLLKLATFVRKGKLVNSFTAKEDGRPGTPYKLVFFCGEYGLNYLNASLASVYRSWDKLPEIFIVSDGTPVEKIRSGLIEWPRKTEIISWTTCAEHFRNNGNAALSEYAEKDLWGKKFVAINYCAKQFPSLYSDTDILWFSSPDIKVVPGKPIMKMCQDISHCYSNEMLGAVHQEKINTTKPLNAGLIYANGDFSTFDGWQQLCTYLSTKPDNRTEQTSFAILNNYFNQEEYFSLSEVLIKVDDELSLRYTKKDYPNIIARHYVNVKATTFWRDFVYMYFKL